MNPLVIVAVIAFITGSGVSFKLTQNYYLAEKYFAVREEQIKAKAIEEERDRERERARNADIRLLEAQAKEVIKYEEVIKYVPKYITKIQKTDSACNLTSGAVSMLNRSTGDEGLPQTSAIDDAANTRSSEIRAGDLIKYAAKLQTQYQRVAQQCRSLISWNNNAGSTRVRPDQPAN